jgi:alpha-tubulin suppressor-like RCC1 family protein
LFVCVCIEPADVKVALPSNPGFVLVVGEGDTGQLGLGPDVMDRSRPGRVGLPANVVQVCAGGMHSVCLTLSGEVSGFHFDWFTTYKYR